ncbi:MAG: CPBP family intramembrane glutamic endopeptidase [Dermatophilaceae bacterium]
MALFGALCVVVAVAVIVSAGVWTALDPPLVMNWITQFVLLATGLGAYVVCRRWISGRPLDTPSSPWLVTTAMAVVTCLALIVPLYLLANGRPTEPPGPEELLFQATMPGLAEEVVFRGVLLGVLLPAFPTSRRVLGMPLNTAIVLQALVFALLHASGGLFSLGMTFALGLLLGSLRLRFDSILPCIVFHNAYNFLSAAVLVVVSR